MKSAMREIEIGILYGEGIGSEIIQYAKSILAAVEDKSNLKCDYCIGPACKPPQKTRRGVVNPIYAFS